MFLVSVISGGIVNIGQYAVLHIFLKKNLNISWIFDTNIYIDAGR